MAVPINSEPPSDSVEAFSRDLSELRTTAGSPTVMALSRKTQISKSVVSDAFSGGRLPTPNTTKRLVSGLGGDPAPWLERRAALDPRVIQGTFTPSDSGRRSFGPGVLLAAVAATAAVTALATSGIWFATTHSTDAASNTTEETPTSDSPTELIPAIGIADLVDGLEPSDTVCLDDALIAASEQRADGMAQVQILWSEQCKGVWARVTRYDGLSGGNAIGIRIYPQVDPESSRSQERMEFDSQSVYTTLFISPDPAEHVCAMATMTVANEEVELSPQLCI